MSEIRSFKIPPLTEADLDVVMKNAGGNRLHPDHDRRKKIGADYRLGDTLIELKFLDDEGLDKVERQEKLHRFFGEIEPDQDAITLDRNRLQGLNRARFDRIMDGPIKTAAKKANAQLKQSRSEFPDAKRSVLLLINNNYMSLEHRAIVEQVLHRVRQDTTHIDAIVVAGIYYQNDAEGGYLLTPMHHIKIRTEFVEFDRLYASWEAFGECFVNRLMQPGPERNRTKGPISEKQFRRGDVTYTRPAPNVQDVENLFTHGILNKTNTGTETSIYVARTLPHISRNEWFRFRHLKAPSTEILDSYEMWMEREAQGRKDATPTCPLVTMPVTADDWLAWCKERGENGLISQFVNERFKSRLDVLKSCARDRRKCMIIPARYTLAVTTVLGPDEATALSGVFIVNTRTDGSTYCDRVVDKVGLSLEHAIALAAAYAIREEIESIMWESNG